jgi:hypothetical protein
MALVFSNDIRVRTVRRGPVRNMRTLSAVPGLIRCILILDRYRCIRHVGQLHTAVELETSREPDDTRRQNCMTLIANWWMGAVRSENCRLNLRRLSQNALVRARGGRSARSHSAARPSCHGVSARPSVQHATRARQASDGFLLSW